MVARTPHFRITGVLGGATVSASWREGALAADDELLEAALELALSGRVFVSPVSGRTLHAGLAEPFPALLTVMGY